jgi:hypothetical protein
MACHLTIVSFTAVRHYPIRFNPTRTQLAQSYNVKYIPAHQGEIFEETVCFVSKGARCDLYEGNKSGYSYKVFDEGGNLEGREYALWEQPPSLQRQTPTIHAMFFVEFYNSVVVQDKVGPSICSLLQHTWQGFKSYTPDAAQQVTDWLFKVFQLTDGLASSGVDWPTNLDVCNIHLALSGGLMIWVDLSDIGPGKGLNPCFDMKVFLGCLMQSMPSHDDSWNFYHHALFGGLQAAIPEDCAPGWYASVFLQLPHWRR